ncbi:hypothetical protein F5X99DRAFT_377304 [Biscogniauxia marginata]|nr:hypothetical protein F5X99DRAFT_377304 [Biscogniauxia marginata]
MADRPKRSKRSSKSTNHLRRARGQADDGTSEASRTSEATRHSESSRHSEASRNASSRSSAYYDDTSYHQSHQAHEGHGAPSIRSTASRFSLNEQFAATRREIEFDFDDSSSVLGRSTIASQPLDELVPNDATQYEARTPRLSNIDNFYDLLCVSRDPSPESIRRAYFRLFTLLYPDAQPPHLRHAASIYFMAVQTAFETLLDPCRRLKYDFDCLHDGTFNESIGSDQQYEDYRRWHIELLSNREHQANVDAGLECWELGARFDAQELFSHLKHGPQYGLQNGTAAIEPVDFEMGYSFLIHLPGLDHRLRHATRIVQESLPARLVAQQTALAGQVDKMDPQEHPTSSTRDDTVLVIRSSVYGFLQQVSFLPIITLLDPYQPSFSTTPTKDRLAQLQIGKVHPLIAIRLRHNLSQRNLQSSHSKVEQATNANAEDEDGTIIEAETEVLPELAASIGLSKRVIIPYDKKESVVQIGARSTLWDKRFPRLWLSLRRPTIEGAFLCSVDSGDWQIRADETSRILSNFSARVKRKILHLNLPLYRTPKIELAYKIGGLFEPRETLMVDRFSNRGLRELDKDFGNSKVASWTVSAAAEPSYLSTSLKYVRDVGFWLPQQTPHDLVEHVDVYHKQPGHIHDREVRIEAELSSSSVWTGYLALRCLKRIGRFSKLGFELGLSSYSLHLSVYWSRLGRRINLPFLMCSRENLNTGILFWTTLVPFTSFAAWEAWSRYRRLRQYRQHLKEEKAKSKLRDDQGYKRVEADQVTSLMAAGVQNKMRAEYASNGLVVLSAKYGVKAQGTSNAWGAEEVADVTVPVAALVDGGRLYIPPGVCKSNIIGFWDPSPGEEKVLHVRYTYKGKEATVEVSGDDEELDLPSPPP